MSVPPQRLRVYGPRKFMQNRRALGGEIEFGRIGTKHPAALWTSYVNQNNAVEAVDQLRSRIDGVQDGLLDLQPQAGGGD